MWVPFEKGIKQMNNFNSNERTDDGAEYINNQTIAGKQIGGAEKAKEIEIEDGKDRIRVDVDGPKSRIGIDVFITSINTLLDTLLSRIIQLANLLFHYKTGSIIVVFSNLRWFACLSVIVLTILLLSGAFCPQAVAPLIEIIRLFK